MKMKDGNKGTGEAMQSKKSMRALFLWAREQGKENGRRAGSAIEKQTTIDLKLGLTTRPVFCPGRVNSREPNKIEKRKPKDSGDARGTDGVQMCRSCRVGGREQGRESKQSGMQPRRSTKHEKRRTTCECLVQGWYYQPHTTHRTPQKETALPDITPEAGCTPYIYFILILGARPVVVDCGKRGRENKRRENQREKKKDKNA